MVFVQGGQRNVPKRVLHVQIISHETYCFFDVLVAIAVIVAIASTKTIRDRASAPMSEVDRCSHYTA